MSALKTWILFFCAAFWIAACSDGSSPHQVVIEELGDEGSTDDGGNSGKSGQSGGKGSSGSSSKPTSAETIVINGGKDTIYVADAEGSLYYSSGIFCWTEGCEAKFASSSSKAKSSSSSKAGTSGSSGTSASSGKSSSSVKVSSSSVKSSSSAAPPTVTDKDMTDNRDKNKYKIEKIGDVTWMAENLRFKPSSGTYCDATTEVTKEGPGEETETVNVCEQFGMFYISQSAGSSACPPGWRLPTQGEANAAWDAKMSGEHPDDKWWTLGGRFDLEEKKYGKNGSEGRLWVQTSGGKNSMQIMYFGSWSKEYLSADAGKRAFNVRCVTTN